ncbi:MAG: M28 family peptidase [Clostridia bacterium]|nr:M28 family peptidase [Clostridia bacterium]
MTETTKTILDKYQVRKTKKQKSEFIDYLTSSAKNMGYTPTVESGSLGSRNVVIGDVSKAKVVYTAHYDTCPALPFPNFITPKNFLIYFLYQIFITLIFLVIPLVALEVIFMAIAKASGLGEDLSHIIFMVIYFLVLGGFLALTMAGPANKHTVNDNTSGVTTLIDTMTILPDELKSDVAFIFFDLEEAGLVGSKSFFKKHKNVMNNKLLVNFDCVSDGENILLVLSKKARGYAKNLEEAFKANDNVKVEIATKGVFYPSDQASFPCGVGVAALNYSKALKTYYMDKIHADKDRVYREENIEFLAESSVKLASILSSKQ